MFISAAYLSAKGEQILKRHDLNINGLLHILNFAKEKNKKIFWPSSIAVFGPTTPKNVDQYTITEPTTIYGVSKLSGESLCHYYHNKWN